MTRRAGVIGLVLAIIAIALAYLAVLVTGRTPAWAPWAYMTGMTTAMLSTTVLGAARRLGGVGRLAAPFAFIYLLLLGGFSAALLMAPEAGADVPLWLGLPKRAAIVMYGIGVLPLFLLPFAYALTFDSMTLSEDDLARIAEARHERVERERAGGSGTR